MSLCGGRWWGSYGVMVSDDGICSSNGVGLFRAPLGSSEGFDLLSMSLGAGDVALLGGGDVALLGRRAWRVLGSR